MKMAKQSLGKPTYKTGGAPRQLGAHIKMKNLTQSQKEAIRKMSRPLRGYGHNSTCEIGTDYSAITISTVEYNAFVRLAQGCATVEDRNLLEEHLENM